MKILFSLMYDLWFFPVEGFFPLFSCCLYLYITMLLDSLIIFFFYLVFLLLSLLILLVLSIFSFWVFITCLFGFSVVFICMILMWMHLNRKRTTMYIIFCSLFYFLFLQLENWFYTCDILWQFCGDSFWHFFGRYIYYLFNFKIIFLNFPVFILLDKCFDTLLIFWTVNFFTLIDPFFFIFNGVAKIISVSISFLIKVFYLNFKFIWLFLLFIVFVLPILLAVAYYTLGERKIMGSIQRRKGPNVAGFFGVLQPLADGVKLIFKEIIIPQKSKHQLFIFSPILTFALSLMLWTFFPFTLFFGYIDSPYSLLYLFAISSLSIFGIIGAGWASNSKYAILGSLRSAGQLISYEISIGFSFLIIALVAESLNILDILLKQVSQSNFVFLFPILFIFFISALAETNRAPFDLPEAEAEIVAGYNIEYSGVMFALFFLGEYSNMLIMSIVTVVLFFGKSLLTTYGLFIFCFKVSCVASVFIIVRATLPRVRYDQLMFLGWNIFLPLSLGFFFFILSLYYSVDLFFFWNEIYYFEIFFNLFLY